MSEKQDLVQLTADIVAAYVSGNTVASAEIPNLVAGVHASLANLGKPVEATAEPLRPPVSIKKSITSDYLISLEDGKQYKSLKRHLAGKGLTPADYRAKWGLPRDYPMVAPAYSEQRSQLARAAGLGQARKTAAAAKAALAKKGRARKAS